MHSTIQLQELTYFPKCPMNKVGYTDHSKTEYDDEYNNDHLLILIARFPLRRGLTTWETLSFWICCPSSKHLHK